MDKIINENSDGTITLTHDGSAGQVVGNCDHMKYNEALAFLMGYCRHTPCIIEYEELGK